ncbi:hypothetical protein FSS13T_12290 [Flavobacterium saliperosum S13]|uniref:ORF6N domain-containing protein n=2 Tax=Flavobacterium saliperosum TaxID=329186 RepID=A0A1G4W2R4_9FLAO|nr:ORF6N domain-containing protein [Flavobacterium saliperosum]ESU26078.1 hypothetical protein FSS13T_12290 [Flavobacterium saliperosum S13]SCX15814.1 ORF6N domain-containing protein [Flavobacterium saliperosum]
MPKSNEFTALTEEVVMNQIYLIRNQKVMLDRDLAKLYGVETKVLKQQVRRNIKRFPEDFMFEMTETESRNLRSQFVTSSWGGNRYVIMCFTEQGVAMLSSVLKSEQAIKVNIQIIRVFTKLRSFLLENTEVRLEIEQIKKKLDNHGKNIELVFQYLDELIEKSENKKPREKIGYKK